MDSFSDAYSWCRVPQHRTERASTEMESLLSLDDVFPVGPSPTDFPFANCALMQTHAVCEFNLGEPGHSSEPFDFRSEFSIIVHPVNLTGSLVCVY